jgi:carbamoyltransferase
MDKYVIGISAFYHDSSACLFKNGELVFACEEEKFTGIKHDSSFPTSVLDYIFYKFDISKDDVDMVCYYENPEYKKYRVIETIHTHRWNHPIFALNSYMKIKRNIRKLKNLLPQYGKNVFYSKHHNSHNYYSFYTSRFKEAMCLSVDGVGEFDTISYGNLELGKGSFTPLAIYPHSLGLYYSAMTSFLGFRPNEGEYKVMGLASYGDPEIYIEKVRKLIKYENETLTCNMDVFTWNRSNKTMYNNKLVNLLEITERTDEYPLFHEYCNLAAAVQLRYEEVLFEIINTISRTSKTKNLCLSGGCAYNGSANGKITTNTKFKHLWIPPAPSDAGSSVGACIDYLVTVGLIQDKITRNPYLGPSYTDEDILQVIRYEKFRQYGEKELYEVVAKQLSLNKVVGWFQGHIEFGARALGNRSILADPTLPNMKDRINNVIKKREGFRPFAPVVIKEKQDEYFEMVDDVPYMNQVVKVKPEFIGRLEAVTHIDGTARVQTIYKHTKLHNLLLECEKQLGIPMLLNTSMNIKDKTMCLTPEDALKMFYDCDMDLLVMNNFIIYK